MKKAAVKRKIKIVAYALLGAGAIFLTYAAFAMTSAQRAYEYIAAGDYAAASSILEQIPRLSRKISDAKTLCEAMKLMDEGNYAQAEALCERASSFDSEEILRKAYYLCARRAENQGDAFSALKLYLTVGSYMDSMEKARQLTESVYVKGVELFDGGNDAAAYAYFMEVLDYRDAKQYISAIDADTYEQLVAMIDFKGARKKLARYAYIRQFLTGHWWGDGGGLWFQQQGSSFQFSVHLNVRLAGTDFSVEDGRLVFSSEPPEAYHIDITGADSMTVTHERSGRVYRMTRK